MRWLVDNIEEVILSVLLTGLTGAVLLQVYSRFIAGAPVVGTDEFANYCFIWMVFIGVSSGIKRNLHIKIDFLANLGGGRLRKPLSIFSDLMFLLLIVVLVYLGIKELLSFIQFPRLSPAMRIPIWWIYLAMPVGLTLAGLRILQKFLTPQRDTAATNSTGEIIQ
jgi:TRAP-type C4-dicarboxylate transport system permease small subunit